MRTIFLSLVLIISMIFMSGCESKIIEINETGMLECSVGCDNIAKKNLCMEVMIGYETHSLNDTEICKCYLQDCFRSLE